MAAKIPPVYSDTEKQDDLSPPDPDAPNTNVSPGPPETSEDEDDERTEENNRANEGLVVDAADTSGRQQPKDYFFDGAVKGAPLPVVGGKDAKKKKEDKKKVAQPADVMKDDGKKYTPDAPPRETPGQTFSSLDIYRMIIFLVLAAVFLVIAILIVPTEPEIKSDLDFVKIYENTLNRLQLIFTNQTDRFWRILKNRGLAHLRNTNPRQPLVFLLAAPPAAHGIVDCLATELAQELDAKHKRNLAIVDGAKEKHKPGEKAKKDMDELLIEKFQNGHRVALIRHLELLPPPSPLLFYSYCDDQNAPHKHVAIIFTVHLPEEPDLSLPANEAEGAVEKYLANQVWAKEEQDSVAALLSRVADTVALINGETTESVKSFCM